MHQDTPVHSCNIQTYHTTLDTSEKTQLLVQASGIIETHLVLHLLHQGSSVVEPR